MREATPTSITECKTSNEDKAAIDLIFDLE